MNKVLDFLAAVVPTMEIWCVNYCFCVILVLFVSHFFFFFFVKKCSSCIGEFVINVNESTCQAWTVCNNSEYTTTVPSTTLDRTCAMPSTCAAGMKTIVEPSPTTNRVCNVCAIGQYQERNAFTGTKCSTCSAGQYASSAAATVCNVCETGKNQELTESIEYSCKFCAAGKKFATKSTACVESDLNTDKSDAIKDKEAAEKEAADTASSGEPAADQVEADRQEAATKKQTNDTTVGIVSGLVGCMVICIFCIFVMVRRRRNSKQALSTKTNPNDEELNFAMSIFNENANDVITNPRYQNNQMNLNVNKTVKDDNSVVRNLENYFGNDVGKNKGKSKNRIAHERIPSQQKKNKKMFGQTQSDQDQLLYAETALSLENNLGDQVEQKKDKSKNMIAHERTPSQQKKNKKMFGQTRTSVVSLSWNKNELRDVTDVTATTAAVDNKSEVLSKGNTEKGKKKKNEFGQHFIKEDQEEEGHRVEWIQHYVATGQLDEARKLGWTEKPTATSEWDEHSDEHGRKYRVHRTSGVSKWVDESDESDENSNEEENKWDEYTDELGRKYSVHRASGESKWVVEGCDEE